MERIPFNGPSYTVQSINADNQACINCYLEKDQQSSRAPLVLYGTPGTRPLVNVGNGPIRGCRALVGTNYAIVVSGNQIFTLDNLLNVVLRGTMQTSTGRVSISDNGAQVIIVDGHLGYIAAIPVFVFNTLNDPNFQNGAQFIDFQSTFFFTSGQGNGSPLMKSSNVGNGAIWSGTDYAEIETESTYLLRAFATRDQLFIFTPKNMEVWYNAGNPAFPYSQTQGVLPEHGCAAPNTIVAIDNSIMWLGQDETGIGPVWKMKGYDPQNVSNPLIDREIQSYGDVSDAFAFSHQVNNHLFYVLTFPTADKTWVYDVATSMWHQRAWYDSTTGLLHRWRPNCFMSFNSMSIVGDFQTGQLYTLDPMYNQDGTGPLLRLRRSITLENNQQRRVYSRLQIDMQTGIATQGFQPNIILEADANKDIVATNSTPAALLVSSQSPTTLPQANPRLRLRWSDDGGHRWSSYRLLPLGRIGEYKRRAIANLLGNGRNRIWEISMTDPVPFAVLGALATFTEGLPE